MKRLAQHWGIAALLFLAGVAVVGAGITYVTSATVSISTETVAAAPAPEEVSDVLELLRLGQYYFNHDEDPEGPYDLVRARSYYEEIIIRDPEYNVLPWYQLGRISFLEGKFSSALYLFNKQIELFGDEIPNVYYMLGLTYGYRAKVLGYEEDWEPAADAFRTYITYDETAPWARVDLAWVYFSEGKFEEMKAPLEEGLLHHPDNPWLLNMYGLALMNTGDRDAAHAQFLRAEEVAATLSVADWGHSYPGNDPASWETGLLSFQEVIKKNRTLVSK